MSTCSFLPSIAKRELAPLPTGDSNTNCPPCDRAAMAIRTQFFTIVLARTTVAGRPVVLLWHTHWMHVGSQYLWCSRFESCRGPCRAWWGSHHGDAKH
eukprot:4323110-Pleurochrysis_carterae.AAC.1